MSEVETKALSYRGRALRARWAVAFRLCAAIAILGATLFCWAAARWWLFGVGYTRNAGADSRQYQANVGGTEITLSETTMPGGAGQFPLGFSLNWLRGAGTIYRFPLDKDPITGGTVYGEFSEDDYPYLGYHIRSLNIPIYPPWHFSLRGFRSHLIGGCWGGFCTGSAGGIFGGGVHDRVWRAVGGNGSP